MARIIEKRNVLKPTKNRLFFLTKEGHIASVPMAKGGKKGRKVATTTKAKVLKQLKKRK